MAEEKMSNSKKPHIYFIGIGASRCATNWIAKCLGEHPEIYMAYPNELSFFSHPKKGKSNYELEGIEGYYKRFAKSCGKKAGEFSPTYFYDPSVAEILKKHFPNIKIIASLRNPISRYSSEKTYFKNFQFLDKDRRELIERSKYYESLLKYYNIFGKDNIKVIIMDDINKNPLKVIQELYSFLNVRNDFSPPSINTKTNEVSKAKYKELEKYRQGASKIAEFFKKRNLNSVVNILRKLGVNKLSWKIWEKNRTKINKENMSLEEKRSLLQEFMEDITKTEKLLNRDLSKWKKIE